MRVTNDLFGMSMLIGLAVATHSAPAAASDTCRRWANEIQGCDFASFQDCNNPTPQQQITINNYKYADTPEAACKKYFQKHDNYTGPVQLPPGTTTPPATTYVECIRQDAQGAFNPNFKTIVSYPLIQKDACCGRTPNGPYRDLSVGFTPITRDGAFTKTQKNAILMTNASRSDSSSFYMSDAGDNFLMNYVYPLGIDVTYLAKNSGQIWALPPEVDHIIPRVDSHGCGCGNNKFENALVISNILNNSTSNDCTNPERVEILNAYSSP